MPGRKMASPRGGTRLQLSLQHAAADREGGSASVGQWIQFRNAELAGSIAGLGGDFVIIDSERGRITTAADLSLVVDAVANAGASPIVRVPASEPKRIRWAQDSGAHGVMVAMCETKTQAERAVVATGCPSPRFVVIVEIGSRLAIDNVDGIAAVAGIDALFVGPSPSPAANDDDDDDDAAVLAAARRHAKFAGHFAADAGAAAALVRRGWRFVSCGSTTDGLAIDGQAVRERTVSAASREMESLRAAMAGMRRRGASRPPATIEGDEYEWDGKDWG